MQRLHQWEQFFENMLQSLKHATWPLMKFLISIALHLHALKCVTVHFLNYIAMRTQQFCKQKVWEQQVVQIVKKACKATVLAARVSYEKEDLDSNSWSLSDRICCSFYKALNVRRCTVMQNWRSMEQHGRTDGVWLPIAYAMCVCTHRPKKPHACGARLCVSLSTLLYLKFSFDHSSRRIPVSINEMSDLFMVIFYGARTPLTRVLWHNVFWSTQGRVKDLLSKHFIPEKLSTRPGVSSHPLYHCWVRRNTGVDRHVSHESQMLKPLGHSCSMSDMFHLEWKNKE